jgi:hypothetical protein
MICCKCEMFRFAQHDNLLFLLIATQSPSGEDEGGGRGFASLE